MDPLIELFFDVQVVVVAEIVVVAALQLLHQRVLAVEPRHEIVVHLRLGRCRLLLAGVLFVSRQNAVRSNHLDHKVTSFSTRCSK